MSHSISPPPSSHRLRNRLLLLALVVCFTINHWSGPLLKWGLEYTASYAGVTLHIKRVELDVWHAQLRIDDVTTIGFPMQRLHRLELDGAWSAWLHGEKELLRLRLVGLNWQVEELSEAKSEEKSSPFDVKQITERLPVRLHLLELQHAHVRFLNQEHNMSDLTLHSLRLQRISPEQYDADLKLSAVWSGYEQHASVEKAMLKGSFILNGEKQRMTFKGALKSASAKLKQSKQSLAWKAVTLVGDAAFYPQSGSVESHMHGVWRDLRVVKSDKEWLSLAKLDWQGDAAWFGEKNRGRSQFLLAGSELNAVVEDQTLALADLKLSGDVVLDLNRGDVKSRALTLILHELHLARGEAERVVLNRLNWQGDVSLDGRKETLLTHFTSQWHDLNVVSEPVSHLAFLDAVWDGDLHVQLAKKRMQSHVQLTLNQLQWAVKDLHADVLKLSTHGDVSLDQQAQAVLVLDGKQLQLDHPQGKVALDHLLLPLDVSLDVNDAANSWRLGEIALMTPMRVVMDSSNLQHIPVLWVKALKVSGLNAQNPEQDSDVQLHVVVGESPQVGEILLSGTVKPLLQWPEGKLFGNLIFEAAPLSPFAVSALGLQLNSGRIQMEAGATLKQQTVDANTHLVMNHLRVSQADALVSAKVQELIGLSPDAALDLLRDGDDRITLNIPVHIPLTGDVDAVRISGAAIYRQAMLGVLKKGAIAYVKNIFQPYGMAIDALQWLGEQRKKMRLKPIFFAIHGEQPNSDGLQAVEQVSGFLKQYPKMTVAICGVATREEAVNLGGVAEAWQKLAHARVAVAMEQLMQAGVKREQMTLCHNTLDEKEKGRPRVEVLL